MRTDGVLSVTPKFWPMTVICPQPRAGPFFGYIHEICGGS